MSKTIQNLNEKISKLLYKRSCLIDDINLSFKNRSRFSELDRQIRLLNKNKRKIDALIDKMYQISITAKELSIEDIVEF